MIYLYLCLIIKFIVVDIEIKILYSQCVYEHFYMTLMQLIRYLTTALRFYIVVNSKIGRSKDNKIVVREYRYIH